METIAKMLVNRFLDKYGLDIDIIENPEEYEDMHLKNLQHAKNDALICVAIVQKQCQDSDDYEAYDKWEEVKQHIHINY